MYKANLLHLNNSSQSTKLYAILYLKCNEHFTNMKTNHIIHENPAWVSVKH